MSDEVSDEPWEPDRIAAECKAAADAKVTRKRGRSRREIPPPIPITSEAKPTDPPKLPIEGKDEFGRFTEGHGFSPKPGDPGIGPPTKYKPEFCEIARKLCTLGATMNEVADFLEVSLRSIYLWRNVHAEFAEAIKIGWKGHMDRATRSLYERAVGFDYIEEVAIKVKVGKDSEEVRIVEVRKHQPADVTASIFVHTNRDPENWKHKRTIEHQGSIDVVGVDQARRELEEFYTREVINGGTLAALPTPDLGGEADRDDDF